MKINGFHFKNFRVLRDVSVVDLPGLSVFIGANGSGKSTLLQAFRTLRDVVTLGAPKALADSGLSDFPADELERTALSVALVGLGRAQSLTYTVALNPLPDAVDEVIDCQVDEHQSFIVRLKRGVGSIWLRGFLPGGMGVFTPANSDGEEQSARAADEAGFALAGVNFSEGRAHGANEAVAMVLPEVRRVLQRLEIIDGLPVALRSGGELAKKAFALQMGSSQRFAAVRARLCRSVPGLEDVRVFQGPGNRPELEFVERGVKGGLLSSAVSDGTLKLLSLLIELYDPKAPLILLVEEPENYLHPDLLGGLAEEFRGFAERGGQVFVTTHSPDFVNALRLEELFWLVKENGASTIRRASDDALLRDLVAGGDLPGYLWQQRLLTGAGLR